jgi:catechol 2,3-dioxygenase-like lactoylglutathione lyase family enzyme
MVVSSLVRAFLHISDAIRLPASPSSLRSIPTVGGADICLRWSGDAESAVELLRQYGILIVDGPSPRRTADGLPAHSVYFRDPDGNLVELMAADGELPRS